MVGDVRNNLHLNCNENTFFFIQDNTAKHVSTLTTFIFSAPQYLKWPYCSSTHWGGVMHICVGNLTIIGSDNGLWPGRCQAIIWTNDVILWIRSLGTHFSEILIEFLTFWFKKMHFNMSSAKWQPFCLGLNVLTIALSNPSQLWYKFCFSLCLAVLLLSNVKSFYCIFYHNTVESKSKIIYSFALCIKTEGILHTKLFADKGHYYNIPYHLSRC